jgi:hypothetical protein
VDVKEILAGGFFIDLQEVYLLSGPFLYVDVPVNEEL